MEAGNVRNVITDMISEHADFAHFQAIGDGEVTFTVEGECYGAKFTVEERPCDSEDLL